MIEKINAKTDYVKKICYPFLRGDWRFSNGNIYKVLGCMTEEEQLEF